LNLRRLGCIGLGALAACDKPAVGDRKPPVSITETRLADSLVLTAGGGAEVWLSLARAAKGADGTGCVERGLEIRRGGKRVKVPLLYTGSPPVLLNDTTIRAVLWNHCAPGEPYLVDLRSGRPIPERRGAAR
jgi:hypothetical protein